jgi:hypothetical protein
MARAAGVPIVAIGGVTLPRVHELAPLVDCCAVIGDLWPAKDRFVVSDVTERACALHAALGGDGARAADAAGAAR